MKVSAENSKLTLLAAILLVLGAACSQGNSAEDPTGMTTPTTQETATTMKPPPKAPDIDLAAMPDWFQNEDAAPLDLIAVIGGEIEAEYVGSMAVTWPTGGLGCSSGNYDLQVLTPGYVIFYQAGSSLHRIHTAENGRWIECALGRALEGVPTVTS